MNKNDKIEVFESVVMLVIMVMLVWLACFI